MMPEKFNIEPAKPKTEPKVKVEEVKHPNLVDVLKGVDEKMKEEHAKMGPAPENAGLGLIEERKQVFRDRRRERENQNSNSGFKKAA